MLTINEKILIFVLLSLVVVLFVFALYFYKRKTRRKMEQNQIKKGIKNQVKSTIKEYNNINAETLSTATLKDEGNNSFNTSNSIIQINKMLEKNKPNQTTATTNNFDEEKGIEKDVIRVEAIENFSDKYQSFDDSSLNKSYLSQR